MAPAAALGCRHRSLPTGRHVDHRRAAISPGPADPAFRRTHAGRFRRPPAPRPGAGGAGPRHFRGGAPPVGRRRTANGPHPGNPRAHAARAGTPAGVHAARGPAGSGAAVCTWRRLGAVQPGYARPPDAGVRRTRRPDRDRRRLHPRARGALPAGHRGDRRRDRLAGRPRRRTGGGSRPAVHRRRLGRRQPVGGRLPDAARARRRAAGRHGPELRRVRRQSVSRLDRQVRRRRIPAVDPADGVVLLELPARRRRSAGSAHQPGARGPARPAAGLHGHHRTRPAARHQPGHGRAPARSRRGRAGEGLSGHGAQFSGGGIAGAGQRGRLRRYRGLVARGAAAGCGGGGDPYGEHQP